MVRGMTANVLTNGQIPGVVAITDPAVVAIPPTGSAPTLEATANGRYLQSSIPFDVGGVWWLNWSANYTPNVFVEKQVIPVTVFDTYKMTLNIVGVDAETLVEKEWQMMMALTMSATLRQFSTEIPVYDNLSQLDIFTFDQALAFIYAAYWGTSTPTSMVATGQIASVGTGPDKIEFHRTFTEIDGTMWSDYLSKAWYLLMQIPVIAATFDEQHAAVRVFKPAGRRRAVRTGLGAGNEYMTPLYDLTFDMRMLRDYGMVGPYAEY